MKDVFWAIIPVVIAILFWMVILAVINTCWAMETNEPNYEVLVEFKGVVVGIDPAYCYKEKADHYCTEYIFRVTELIFGETDNGFVIAYGLGGETPSGFPGAIYSNDPYLSVGDKVWVAITSVFPDVGLSISGRYMLGQVWSNKGLPWQMNAKAVEERTAKHNKAIDARRKELGKPEEDLSCRPNNNNLIEVTRDEGKATFPEGVFVPEKLLYSKWTGEVSPNPPLPIYTPWKFKPHGIQQLHCLATGFHGQTSCGWPYKWHTKKVKMYWNPIHLNIDGYTNTIFPSSRDARVEYSVNTMMDKIKYAHGYALFKNMGRTAVMSDMLTSNGIATIAYWPYGQGVLSGATTFRNYSDPQRCAKREVDIGINPMYQYVMNCGDTRGYHLPSVVLNALMTGLGIGRFPGTYVLYPYIWRGECNTTFRCMDRWALWEVADDFNLKCDGTGHMDINWWTCFGW
jgi:hypothetical protein